MNGAPDDDDYFGATGRRFLFVTPAIVPGPRPPSTRVRKRTPWHPEREGQGAVARAGPREWFGDAVFVESTGGHARRAHSMSAVVHTCVAIAVLLFFITRPDQLVIVRPHAPMLMPAILAPLPTMPTVEPPKTPPAERPQPKNQSVVNAADIPAPPTDADVLAPIEAPSGVKPETGAENRVGGVVGGVPDGVPGGVVGGTGTAPAASTGPPGPRVMRAGSDVKPPRKIKDVKPVYPETAMPTRVQGSVLIEAIIGTDGKVQGAKVLLSVPALDQAALDAVRQWEYEPTMLNGVPIAIVMTIVVRFALQ